MRISKWFWHFHTGGVPGRHEFGDGRTEEGVRAILDYDRPRDPALHEVRSCASFPEMQPLSVSQWRFIEGNLEERSARTKEKKINLQRLQK
jgi:hypothetical protein